MTQVTFKVKSTYEDKIRNVISKLNIAELKTMMNLLPQTTYDLGSYGLSYINIFYKECASLESQKGPNGMDDEIEEKQMFLYNLYLLLSYDKIYPTFNEFKTFSNLMVVAFDEYNPNIRRDLDSAYVSLNKESFMASAIVYKYIHSHHPHAFEIDASRVMIVNEIIQDKINCLIEENLKKNGCSSKYMKYFETLDLPKDKKVKIKKFLKG